MAAEKTMHAVQYGGYGGGAEALKHVEVPIPLPKKNEVLLKIDAAAINPFDWKVQKGAMRPFLPPKFPFTPVEDVAGEVVDVGPEVKSLKQGDKVVSLLSTGGGLAEYAVASANLTTTIPPTIPPPEAAGLPAASLTALLALRSAGCFDLQRPPNQQPKNILITAASGGVGHFATQLAKLANLHVTATCGARNMELVRSLGADEVLDYKTPEGASLKSPSEKKYDAVIHCATGISWSEFKPNLAEGGKVIDITPTVKVMLTWVLHRLTFCKKQLVPLLLSPEGKDLEFIVGLVKEGKLRTVVDSRYPLEKAEDAWGKSMAGHATGKIIVEM